MISEVCLREWSDYMFPELKYKERIFSYPALSGGIVIDRKETELSRDKSPDMLNMIFDGKVLRKREGQQELFHNDTDFISCHKDTFYNYIIFHSGSKLKAYNCADGEIYVLYERLSLKKGVFFSFNGYVYYIGSGDFYKISHTDGKLIAEQVEGYLPTVLVNCDKNGLGDKNEEFNFLTLGFKVSYSTGAVRELNIPYAPLDSEKPVTITLGGEKVRHSEFTVDYESGKVTFYEEIDSGHNLLEISAYQKGGEERKKITDCTVFEVFGGLLSGVKAGTRVFLSGNDNFKSTFFYSDLKNPEYFPVNQFDMAGDDGDKITVMGKQSGNLVIFKEKSIYISAYSYGDDGVNFTLSQISDHIGCDCPETLVSIDNQLVWLNSDFGVLTLTTNSIRDEKNIKRLSENINGYDSKKALLSGKSLSSAVGFVNRGKYYIVTDDFTYVLNMKYSFSLGLSPEKLCWFIFDNIRAEGVIFINREAHLYYKNQVTYFSKVLYDMDKETPINAYVRTAASDFGLSGILKYIKDISFYMSAINNSYACISFRDEEGKLKKKYEYTFNRFNFNNFTFSDFTFCSRLFSVFLRRGISRRGANFFTVTFENSKPNSQMAISDINITYFTERGARYNGI